MNTTEKKHTFSFRRSLSAFLITALLIIFDQYTKHLAVKGLGDGKHIPLIPGVLELAFIRNRGAAFGILQDARIFFFIITAVAFCVIGYVLFRIPRTSYYTPLRICLYFIAAGAAGNLIDRILLSYVRDFIYFSLIDFPIFNVADIYITCSAFALVLLMIFYYKDDQDFDFLKKQQGDT